MAKTVSSRVVIVDSEVEYCGVCGVETMEWVELEIEGDCGIYCKECSGKIL